MPDDKMQNDDFNQSNDSQNLDDLSNENPAVENEHAGVENTPDVSDVLDVSPDVSHKSETEKNVSDYNFNEMHCLDFIGKAENPNVTKLSQHLNLTRGAISKIIKKLVKKNAIEIYTTESNKKEIYYKLTPTGQKVFYAHEKMHKKWNNDDLAYLSGIEEKDLLTVNNFLANYNKFTESRIKILKGDNYEDTAD